MTVVIDLFGRPGSGVNEGSVNSTDAAIFTEVPETPRVLADSHSYLAYTMKRSQTLRVVQRATLLKGSLRAHTKPIHAVRFVNYRSNVAASAAEGEFFVWVVTDDSVGVGRDTDNAEGGARLSVKVYFKLKDPVTVPCFSFFINAENKRPDLLILYDTQAAILKSSTLIAKYDREPLEATLRQNSTSLRTLQRAVSIQNSNNNNDNTPALCAVGSGGWFAFTTEPTMVAACTLQNRNTPSWLCCGGDTVRALQLLDTPLEESSTVLVAATTQAVFQWTLTGDAEPTLLRRFVVGPDASIVAMESSRETFAVFDDKKRVAVVSVQPPENFLCTQYVMPAQVRRGGLCFNRVGGVSSVLVDISDRLTVFVLRGPEKKGDETATQQELEKQTQSQEQRKKAATITTAATTKGKETSPTPTADVKTTITTTTASGNVGGRTIEARAGSRIIANLVNQLGLSPSQVHSGTSASNNNNHNNNNNNNNNNTIAAAGTSTTSSVPQRTSPYVHGSRPATAGLAATSGITPPSSSTLSKTGTTTTTTTTTDAVKREDVAHKTSPGVTNTNTTVAAGSTSTNTGGNTTRPALHNASLPQAPTDGVLAAAVSQSEDEVRQALKRLESAMANTSQILQLVPDTIRRDHEQLLNLGLEAQMTELQQQMQKLPLQLQHQQQQQQSASGTSSAAFDTYALVMLMDALSRNIAKGVTRGVEESIATHLDHEVRQAMGNRVRNAQKQVLKNRLDEALKESTTQFVSQLDQTVQGVVRRELAELLGSINGSLKMLENENSALQRELSLVMSSGVVEEMRQMREELRTLRETVMSRQTAANGSSSAHATSSFQGRRPAPETILSTALSLMQEQQQYHQALQYLLQCHQPPLVLQFLNTLSHNHEGTYSDLIEDTSISNDVWCQVLLQLVEAAATSTEMQREVVVSVTVDIISEREGLLASTHGKKVTTAMRDFAQKLRQTTTKVDFLQSIKDLEKLVQ
ncbi:hypothetical protein LSM04_006981 [Trypanosoma melophagium]|uniref:uncharacterized protein n=1 Tax=Trypanosoma melophagium TaxID=715481 RepID=UPI00351A4007|nr:hypothetical protein LSM04_006981 [Trypanosoma melophagium]